MSTMLEKILSHPENEKVLKFLGISNKKQHTIKSFAEKDSYTHEGLEDFLNVEVPDNSKLILDNHGVIILPETGEIIAFQFGRYESAFKVKNSKKYRDKFKHIKKGLLRNFKFRSANKVSLGYFSNIYNDTDTIIDIRELGNEWVLSIYFAGEVKEKIMEFYNQGVKIEYL